MKQTVEEAAKQVFFAMGMELSTGYVAKRKGLQGWCRMAGKAITVDKRRNGYSER